MLRDRRPSLREKIEVTTTSRGRNRNVKVAIDHLNVVAVIHRAADGSEQRIELADVPAVAEGIKAARKQLKGPKAMPPQK
jgi:DnaJ-domain-containing protein 1